LFSVRSVVLVACFATSLASIACNGTQRDLRAVTALYADARYEAVQAWLAQLHDDYPEMSGAELAQFHYLSGMAAYRLSQPDDALHELALAAHAAREQPSALNSDQLALLYRTLEELSANRTE
jgi:hypothetical protein